MLIHAASSLQSLVALTAPGAPVAPVVVALGQVRDSLLESLPALRQSRAGAVLVDQVDRTRNSADQLHHSLAELVRTEGMTTFDASFAADDPSWDAWFTESAQILSDAATRV